MNYRIVTIDGPAGAGKTTVSKRLAKVLGCVYVDTGALYRAVAYEIDRQKIDWENPAALDIFLDRLDLTLAMEDQALVLTSSGRDITPFIRTPKISMLASATSALPKVRRALLGIQKQIAATRDAVFEGRDMGTAVFPEARFKFFSLPILGSGPCGGTMKWTDLKNMSQIKSDMAKRDNDDASRKACPLKPAADAVCVDSTHMTIDQVVEKYVL